MEKALQGSSAGGQHRFGSLPGSTSQAAHECRHAGHGLFARLHMSARMLA